MTENKIKGGATIWARKTINSDIFYWKPDKWFKIWFYLVNRVNHKRNKQFERGSCFTTYREISDITKATKNQIDQFMRWTKKNEMLTTQKTTQGMILNIINYDIYQDFNNYKNDTENETQTKHKRNTNDTINNNDKNDKNDKNIPEHIELKKIILKYIPIEDIENKTSKIYLTRLYNALDKDFKKIKAICKAVEYFNKSEYPYSIYSVRSLYEKLNKIKARVAQEQLKNNNKKSTWAII